MCATDYEYEEPFKSGPGLYKTIKQLKKDRCCWAECGIVKVRIEIKKWVVEQNFKGAK